MLNEPITLYTPQKAKDIVCALNEETYQAQISEEEQTKDSFYYHVMPWGDLARIRVTDAKDHFVGYM